MTKSLIATTLTARQACLLRSAFVYWSNVILILDDHQQTREVMGRLLKREGFNTHLVEGGAEAIEFLQTSTPRLVLLDYSMPDIDGLTVFKHMKGNAGLSVVPVIMFSAFDGDLRLEALALGVKAFVIKGRDDWSVLKKAITQFVRGNGAVAA